VTQATRGLPASVHVRLVRHARAVGADPNHVLARFAAERFLYRLSRSPHGERFVLKGALLMLVWLGETIRPTRDADLLGFGDLSEAALARIFREICETDVERDGVEFVAASVRVAPIRVEDPYGGQRVVLDARLGNARLRVQVDVGVGDAVSPAPEWLEYPGLLDFPRPRLRAYRPETSIAEKVHAMVTLAEANSRMRDFFDVHALSSRLAFHGVPLAQALRMTFERRGTALPIATPVALTPAFADIHGKQAQWGGFLRRNRLEAAPVDLGVVIDHLARFVRPFLGAAARHEAFEAVWPPGGPWKERS
jgi:predicted nucleotidyltransferase component of viral defense system